MMLIFRFVINLVITIIVVISISFYFYSTHFKGGVRQHWCCRGCVVMIIIMSAGDAEDAS